MSETSNRRSVPYYCVCGGRLTSVTFDGGRGIADMASDKVSCPLTVECLNGHKQELWMTLEDARPYFDSVLVVGR